MKDIEIIKQLYTGYIRPVLILDKNKGLIWRNENVNVYNLTICVNDIARRISDKTFERFEIQNGVFSGECEIRFIDNIIDGIYIAEFFEKEGKSVKDSNEYLRSIIRNGINQVSSSLQLLRDNLGESDSKINIDYLNKGMLGCYDMLRGIDLSAATSRLQSCSFIQTVDFSHLIHELSSEIREHCLKLPIKIETSIEPGVFVECDYELLNVAIAQVVGNALRRNPLNDFIMTLKKSDNNALFVVEVCSNVSLNEEKLRKYTYNSKFCEASDQFVLSFLKSVNGRVYEDMDNNKISGFMLPLCQVTSLPFHLSEVRYKGDRFSKFHVLLSEMYEMEFFENK